MEQLSCSAAASYAIIKGVVITVVAGLPCFLHTIATVAPVIIYAYSCCAIVGEHAVGCIRAILRTIALYEIVLWNNPLGGAAHGD